MEKGSKFLLLVLFFLAFGWSRAHAQRIDDIAPAASFSELVFLTYSFYLDETFEVYLDEQGAVAVRGNCEDNADVKDFVRNQTRQYALFSTLPKESLGESITQWRETLPTDIYAALVKQENLRTMAQNNLCSSSDPFCTDNGLYEFPAGVNAGTGEPGPYYSCLGTQPNPAWYYMRILDPGDMDIYMYSTPQVDIDFCCWGPYADPFEPCPTGLTRNKVVDCSYSTHWEETCEIRNAQTGDYYILLITNYSNRPCNIHFSKVDGDATTDCTILPPLVSYDMPACEGHDLHLYAHGTSGDTFHWFFEGGSWTSDEQNPVRTEATTDMSGTYGCVITRDGQQSDTAYIEVVVGANTYYHAQEEACDVFVWDGVEYYEGGTFTISYESLSGCDSIVNLDVTINYTPEFEVLGNHWPIGGSETYISVNEYAVGLENPQAHIDTVLWEVECENWRIEPHGKGETMTLYIYSFFYEPILLHCTTVNVCDSVHHDFSIRTTYFNVEETVGNECFTISPNPSDGNMVLRFQDLTGKAEITVVNNHGQCVDKFVTDVTGCREMTYKMPNVGSGLYYFVLETNGKRLACKVTIVH